MGDRLIHARFSPRRSIQPTHAALSVSETNLPHVPVRRFTRVLHLSAATSVGTSSATCGPFESVAASR